MRRWLGAMLVCGSLFGLLSLAHHFALDPVGALAAPQPAPLPENAIRLRILANSNRPADQAIKLTVRDRVLTYLSHHIAPHASQAETAAILRRDVPAVEHLVNSVLREKGAAYTARATFGPTPFPVKVYGDRPYPAGTYEALRIVLGNGKGHNWWCVVFPQLCYNTMDTRVIPQTGAFPDTPPLAQIEVPGANGHPIPVELRLASVDYGEEWLGAFGAHLAAIWSQLVRTW